MEALRSEHAQDHFTSFLTRLADSFESKSVDAFIDLFLPSGWLRDILICDWDFASIPTSGLADFFKEKGGLPDIVPSSIRVNKARAPPVYDEQVKWIQGFFTFETTVAYGEGVVRLMLDESTNPLKAGENYKVFTLSLTMDALKARPEISGPLRPHGVTHGPTRSRTNWLQDRQAEELFENDVAQVVIVGAGQGGLMLAARLKVLGIKVLVVDKSERVGDCWRKRYHSLVLQDTVFADYFPYLKFPANWPKFIPKDKMANWFESYASIMELNVWLNTTVEPNGTLYDESTSEWTIHLRNTKDNTTRVLKCHQLVQATGLSGEPNVPDFAGRGDFSGTVIHSSQFAGGQDSTGKKAIVIGACNSGHDVAQDLYNNGADVTLIQRSSTLLVSSKNFFEISGALYSEVGPPVEEADLACASFPLNAFKPYAVAMHKAVNDADADLISALERVGYNVGGKGGPGFLYKEWDNNGGYHIDVGCGSLIAEGKIKIKQGHQVAQFEKSGVRFDDNSFIPADTVILATGYRSMRDSCRKIFGSAIADRTREVYGLDAQGEIRGLWRRSGHPGFWFMGGNLILARTYSKYLALQIAAAEEGLMPVEEHS